MKEFASAQFGTLTPRSMTKDDSKELAQEQRGLIERAKAAPGIAAIMELYQQNAELLAQMNAYLGAPDGTTAFTTTDSTAW